MSRLALPLGALLWIALACAPATSPPASAPATTAPAKPQAASGQAAPAAPAAPAAKPAPTAAAAPPAPPTTVNVATLGAISDGGIFLAMDRGYYAAEGIEINLTQTQGGGQVIPSLSTGQLDVAGVTTSAGFFNAWSRDIPIRVVADKGRISPGNGYIGMVIRRDLEESGAIRSPADLRGRRVAVNLVNLGSVGDTLIDKLAARGGVARDQMELVDLSYPDMNAALGSRSIDLALHNEPLITAAVARGLGTRWITFDEVSPDHQISTLMYSPQFAPTETARRFMVAYVRGVRDYVDAFVHGRNRAAAVEVLTRYTTVKDPATYDQMVMAGLSPDGRVNQASIAEDLDYYIRNGYVQQRIDIAEVIDNRYAEYALERLGPYRP